MKILAASLGIFLLAVPSFVASIDGRSGVSDAPASQNLAELGTTDGLNMTFDPNGRVTQFKLGGVSHVEPARVATSGFSLRDLTFGGEHLATGPVETAPGSVFQNSSTSTDAIVLAVVRALPDRLDFEATVSDTLSSDHAFELTFSLPLDANGWRWWRDLRRNETIDSSTTYSDTVVMDNQGRESNALPFAVIVSPASGAALTLGMPPGAASFAVTEYSDGALNITFLLAKSNASRAPLPKIAFFLNRVAEPAWGFRAAAAEHYSMFPDAFSRRGAREGVWVVNSPLDAIPSPGDFGFGFHEVQYPDQIANASLADDALGVETYAYIHPRSFFMDMGGSNSSPSDAEIASRLGNLTSSTNAQQREFSRAVFASGCRNRTGGFAYNVFQRPTWFPPNGWGVEFCYFPSPSLPQANATWNTRFNVTWKHEIDPQFAAASAAGATLDGVFIDGFFSWSLAHVTADSADDFDPAHLVHADSFPLMPNLATLRPVVSAHFGVLDLGRNVSESMRARGARFMQNDLRPGAWYPTGLVDAAGLEVDWFPGGTWTPEAVMTMDFRRTMMAQRPFGMLQNSDFALIDAAEVEEYLERSLFWGFYPSFFANRGDDNDNYWGNATLYERDRPAFKRYVPLIREIAAAGWEPVTRTNSSDPAVLAERFGPTNLTLYIALRNDGAAARASRVTIDLATLGMPTSSLKVVDIVSGVNITHTVNGGILEADLVVNASTTMVLRIRQPTAVPEIRLGMLSAITLVLLMLPFLGVAGSPRPTTTRRPPRVAVPPSAGEG